MTTRCVWESLDMASSASGAGNLLMQTRIFGLLRLAT